MNTEIKTNTENLMTEKEMNQFFFDLMMVAQYDIFTMDGLTFFFNTISEMAKTDSLKVQDTCDDLSRLVFKNSIAFDGALKSYEKNIHNRYRNTDYRKSDVELTDELEFTLPATETQVFDSLAEHTVSIMANKIGHVLSSDKVSDDIKNAVIGVLYAASNEAGVGFDDSPEIAKACFPVIMRALDISAQRAYLHSIDHLLVGSLPEAVNDELKQYEVRFDTKKPHDEDAPEDSQDVNSLADLLSKVMKHPEMPMQLYNVLSNELTEVAEAHSTENVLASLKARKAEVQND
jgi:hypothetical protein